MSRRRRDDGDPGRTLPLRVLHQVRSAGLWAAGERVLLAVSGGLDSVVMLELLAQTAEAHGAVLEVASVDHGLRPEAAAEVAWVGAQAARLGLPFTSLAVALSAGPDLADRARRARRAALRSVGPRVVATAHHLDDQAETVLQHLLRGAGAGGLAGMAPAVHDRHGVRWVRPLLADRRETLVAFAASSGLDWREDPSNPASERGRLRALLPVLAELRGADPVPSLARAATALARDHAALDAVAAHAWEQLHGPSGLAVAGLLRESPAIQLRLLLQLCRAAEVQVEAAHLEAALRWLPEGRGQLGLPGGRALEVVEGSLGVHAAYGALQSLRGRLEGG